MDYLVEAVSLGMEFLVLVYLVAVLLVPVVMEVVILVMVLLGGVLLAGTEVVPLMVKEVGMVDFLAVDRLVAFLEEGFPGPRMVDLLVEVEILVLPTQVFQRGLAGLWHSRSQSERSNFLS